MARRLARIVGALCLIGCGGNASQDEPKTNLDQFVGNWDYTAGTQTATCLGQVFSAPMMGTVQVSKSSANELTAVDSSTGCSYELVVAGETATGKPGTTCALAIQGVSGTGTLSELTLKLNGDKTAHESGAFQAAGQLQGFTVSCDVKVDADLKQEGSL